MNYILKDITQLGIRFVEKQLVGQFNITTRIDECEFDNCFQQVDLVDLSLPDVKASEISELLPMLAQQWIDEKYGKISLSNLEDN
jgi:hypothetical protein